MEYLQYYVGVAVLVGVAGVLNLIINGIPSIHIKLANIFINKYLF